MGQGGDSRHPFPAPRTVGLSEAEPRSALPAAPSCSSRVQRRLPSPGTQALPLTLGPWRPPRRGPAPAHGRAPPGPRPSPLRCSRRGRQPSFRQGKRGGGRGPGAGFCPGVPHTLGPGWLGTADASRVALGQLPCLPAQACQDPERHSGAGGSAQQPHPTPPPLLRIAMLPRPTCPLSGWGGGSASVQSLAVSMVASLPPPRGVLSLKLPSAATKACRALEGPLPRPGLASFSI